MSKPRMYGAMTSYTPNNRMDARFNRKWHDRAKQIADNTIPREERQRRKTRGLVMG